ncbi:MAG: SpoIIIAH-like family protein [Acetatifactor sp.]
MKNLIKKNQLMITALAIMIAIAGYLQFAGNDLEEEYLTVNDDSVYTADASAAGSDGVISENYTAEGLLDLSEEDLLTAEITEIESLDSDMEDVPVENYLDGELQVSDASSGQVTPEEGEIPGEAVFTSTGGVAVLSEAKLLKEQTRAKNKETLLEIINSEGLTDAQKQEAVDTMVEMTAIAEKEAAAEILLEAKGFSDVVVSINGDAVDVVVNASVLDDAMRAQIEDIVKRKTDIEPENIIISTVN